MSLLIQGLFLPSLLLILGYATVSVLARKSHATYPPGPPPKPLIGNALDIPFKKPWIQYLKWSKQFKTDIVHLSAMNTHIFVLQRMEDIVELLEKRSLKYSSRPIMPIMKLLKTDDLIPILPYGSTLRKQRKFLQEGLKKEIMPSYHHIITEKVHILLDQLLQDPAGYRGHCKSLSTAVTMAITFGYDVIPGRQQDRLVELAEFVANESGKLLLPGATLINVVPFLAYVPPWFPGATTQRHAAKVGQKTVEQRNMPFEYVKNNLAAGTSKDCILARFLESYTKSDGEYTNEDEEQLKKAMATIYLTGVDTTWTAQLIFIFTMALHPVEQKKAQEEIDRVVGFNRLPTYEHRVSLRYVEALYREVLRWRPITPLGFPHTTTEEDVYKGFSFPKGAFVFPNNWAISRDESRYQDPETFNPERFFEADGSLNNDTIGYVFGFGRRICPGRHLADSLFWMMIVCTLSMFSISKAHDDDGNEIDLNNVEFGDSIVSQPSPFKCSILPRSKEVEALVRHASEAAQTNLQRRDN